MDSHFTITNTLKKNTAQHLSRKVLGGLPFSRIKEEVLGKKYELSLVFIGSTRSRRLNREYRKKDKPANTLSFPLSRLCGEIFIDPKVAAKDAPLFDTTPKKFIAHLFIHSLLHLKGFAHGGKMERTEEKLRKRFKV